MKDPSNVQVGNQKQLFVDDYVVAEKEHVTLQVGEAEKHGVVLEPTLPTDFARGKVHEGPDGRDDGKDGGESAFCWFWSPYWDPDMRKFRLWYQAHNPYNLAYAESEDGINWTKPMVSRDGRSNLVNWNSPVPILRDNKLVDVLEIGIGGLTATIDPRLPHGSPEKHKVAFYPLLGGEDCAARLGYSADGINWNLYNDGYPVTGRAADTNNQIHWNPLTERYLLHCRQDFAGPGGLTETRGVRIMEHSAGNDLMNHPASWKTLTKFLLDDPDKSVIPGTDTPVFQIHTFPMWYYEGVWFGLTDILAATNAFVPEGEQDYVTRHDRGVWEFYMAPSRDAIHYNFEVAAYPRKALIPRGAAGSYDKDCVRPPSNIITHDDAHWIYYLATNERWGCGRWDARLALAKLRLDGFFFVEAEEKPGSIVTKPFILEGDTLQINVDAKGSRRVGRRGGRIQVEILDEDGNRIPGYSGADAPVSDGVDELRFQPSWKEHRNLSALRGTAVRIRFILHDAKLFSFQVR